MKKAKSPKRKPKKIFEEGPRIFKEGQNFSKECQRQKKV